MGTIHEIDHLKKQEIKMKSVILLFTLLSCFFAFGQTSKKPAAQDDEKYMQICRFKKKQEERIFVKLPDTEKWKITYENYKNNQYVVLVANTFDTLKKPSEYLSLTSMAGMKNVDLTKAMNDSYKRAKDQSKNAELNVIAKDLKAKEPWIIYSIQNAVNEEYKSKVSQVWYLTQGENFFHSCFMSVRDDAFTEEKKKEMINVFKTAKIVYR